MFFKLWWLIMSQRRCNPILFLCWITMVFWHPDYARPCLHSMSSLHLLSIPTTIHVFRNYMPSWTASSRWGNEIRAALWCQLWRNVFIHQLALCQQKFAPYLSFRFLLDSLMVVCKWSAFAVNNYVEIWDSLKYVWSNREQIPRYFEANITSLHQLAFCLGNISHFAFLNLLLSLLCRMFRIRFSLISI